MVRARRFQVCPPSLPPLALTGPAHSNGQSLTSGLTARHIGDFFGLRGWMWSKDTSGSHCTTLAFACVLSANLAHPKLLLCKITFSRSGRTPPPQRCFFDPRLHPETPVSSQLRWLGFSSIARIGAPWETDYDLLGTCP